MGNTTLANPNPNATYVYIDPDLAMDLELEIIEYGPKTLEETKFGPPTKDDMLEIERAEKQRERMRTSRLREKEKTKALEERK